MSYFTEDYTAFFKELAGNNHKDWFHQHKKRYEASVKNPFQAFVGRLIEEIARYDKALHIEAKDCILRINRDIRFSKDKSPYNLHCTAFVSYGGRKDKSIPGIFLRFSPEMVGIMGGCFAPSKEQLHKIRTAIGSDVKGFRALIENKDFVKDFGEIRGEKIKRIPKEFQAAFEKEPLIANKQFYFMSEREPELITREDLLEEMMGYWQKMRPLNNFLINAIQS
ncbi:TIGR02453 family protein [Leptobacterium flavescens]|uniref:TIGR02453 family protein n=1 Tax=Leptobacterium flavescens TaxID=472055 RepID=A0A6P0UI45_9FLAO|nr:DUF2461 domain-containing protein [Leptobacterium flavescens]NER13011.1 TIGR02453 family protein [Leptobacterium flavescens]